MSETRQRRGAHVEQAVLAATLDLLSSRGYDFAVEDVAASASVHKTTIYRRWESKPALVAAAITRLADQSVSAPESDDPLADLEALALQVAVALRSEAGRNSMRATLAAAGSDPVLSDVARDFFASRYAIAVPVIRRAQERGILRPDLDPVLVWQAIVNPMHLDAICGVDTSADRARQLVDLALSGARVREGGAR